MKKLPRLVLAAGAALAVIGGLSACTAAGSIYDGTSITNPQDGKWFQSSRGDVYCLYVDANGPSYIDCDWSTLTTSHAHTYAKSSALQITLVTTKRGTVQCAIAVDGGRSQVPSCDWSTLTSSSGTAR